MGRGLIAWIALAALSGCAPAPVQAPRPAGEPCAASRVELPLTDATVATEPSDALEVRPLPGGKSQIVLISWAGGRTLSDGRSRDVDPVFEPGGQRVVFASDRAGSFDLWSVDRRGGDLRRLTRLDGDERHPDPASAPFEARYVFRPRGLPAHSETLASYRKVLFDHCDAGRCTVATVSSDGALIETLTEAGHDCRSPRWAPSGRELAYVCDGTLQWATYRARLNAHLPSSDTPSPGPRRMAWPAAAELFWASDPTQPETVATFEGFERPVIAPNGVWMLAERVVADERQLWALRRDGARRRVVAGVRAHDAEWSPDGRHISYRLGAEPSVRCRASTRLPLSDVDNLWLFPELYALEPDHRLALQDIAVLERSAWFGAWSEPARARGAPNDSGHRPQMITSDAILFVMHTVFDEALMAVERDVLAPTLRRVLERLRPGGGRDDARLATHLSIARALAQHDGEGDVAGIIAGVVRQQRATAAESAFGELDLSALKPRGHYDRDGLRGYFRAMTWLGRFAAGNAAACNTLFELVQQRGVADDFALLGALYDALVGPQALAGPQLVADIAREHPAWFEAPANDAVIEAEVARRLAAAGTRLGASDAGCYVLPARWTPDAALMEQHHRASRQPPSALDVFAMLGSERAALHAAMRARQPASFVIHGAYGHWLAALQTLIRPLPPGAVAPPFARTAAYRDKLLTTALAGYTTLKHDTILTTLPPRVRMGGSLYRDEWLGEVAVRPRPLVYVEPTPGMYEQLESFARRLAEVLAPLGGGARATADRLDAVRARVLSPLRRALAEQLAGRPTSDELHREVSAIAELVSNNWSLAGGKALVGPHVPRSSCLVVDLWSDPVVRTVHAVGVGDVQPIAVVVPEGDRRLIATGGVYTYYAMDLPYGERPTDARWCERVRVGDLPPRPAWTQSFLQPL